MGLPRWLSSKEIACNVGAAGDSGLIPDSGRSLGGGHGNPFQYSCLENPVDRGAWWATVPRVAESQARLKCPSMPARTANSWWSVGLCPLCSWPGYVYRHLGLKCWQNVVDSVIKLVFQWLWREGIIWRTYNPFVSSNALGCLHWFSKVLRKQLPLIPLSWLP